MSQATSGRSEVHGTAATLERLAALLRADGGLLSAALLAEAPRVPAGDPGLGALAASGPRVPADPQTVALAVEAAYEGLLLHRGQSRLLDVADRDLALLAGDRLYALSLATLAAAGATGAVRELADAIALSARAQGEGSAELETAAWEAAAAAIGWGSDAQLAAAKEAARAGGPETVAALAAAASRQPEIGDR